MVAGMEKCRLREFVPGDAPKVLAMSREPGMVRWLPDQVYANLAEAEEVLGFLIGCYRFHDGGSGAAPAGLDGQPFVLGLERTADGSLIGHVGLSATELGAEIGFAVEEAAQGHGFARAGVGLMLALAASRFGLSEVLGIVEDGNQASRRVLESCGFTGHGRWNGRLVMRKPLT
jgi:RimJ/RimL family protein N-acetyltransferase